MSSGCWTCRCSSSCARAASAPAGGRVLAAGEETLGLLVEILPVFPEDLRRLDGERAVHEDGHVRGQAAVLRQQVEGIDHLLGPLHGEGGDDHLFSPGVAVGDRLGEFVQAVLFVLVVPIPVGRLHEEEIGLVDHRRILASEAAPGGR